MRQTYFLIMARDTILQRANEFDGTDEAVIATDAQGTILFWNGQAERLYGWPEHEALGRNIVDVLATRGNADDGARMMEEFRHGRVVDGEFIAQRRDGAPLMIYVRNLPVREGPNVIGIIGVSRPTARSI
jgi:PAS domain S-box-containing protein